jgi:hypothetical protein
MTSREKFDGKRAELFAKLMGNPNEDELRSLQLHLDALEKWKLLGDTHDDVDHSDENKHTHDHHSNM